MSTSRRLTDRRTASRSEATAAGQGTALGQRGTAGALSAAERHRRIAESAYLSAAARGFGGDHELDDWLAAEREVDAQSASTCTVQAPESPADANR
jgi:hypothetical protein